jgi:ribosomal protein S18 acetylase RimI-like enzyme
MVNLVRVEHEATEPLEAKGFDVYRGWSEGLAEQLVEHSRESEILKRVPRDAAERFIHTDAAHEWYRTKERVVYSLARNAILGGVVWFSRTPREEYGANFTFAIRMYEEARGQGVAGSFMFAAHEDFEEHRGDLGNIWLETDADNVPALKLYARQSYEVVDNNDSRITMVRRTGATAIRASDRSSFMQAP